jgi:hypothetical protein
VVRLATCGGASGGWNGKEREGEKKTAETEGRGAGF